MLILSRDQIEALQAAPDAAMVDRIADHLRAKLPDAVAGLDRERLYHRIRLGIARARDHGFELDTSYTTFVSLMFAIAPGFDLEPGIARMLVEPSIPEAYRFDLLIEEASDADWEAARERGTIAGWDPS